MRQDCRSSSAIYRYKDEARQGWELASWGLALSSVPVPQVTVQIFSLPFT